MQEQPERKEELAKMKHFGQAINNSLSDNKGQSAANWEKIRLFYNGRGSKGERIEVEGDFGPAVEVRRVRMAKGKEELELELKEELDIKMEVLELLEAKMAKGKVELGGKKEIAGSREIKKLPESEEAKEEVEQLTIEAGEQKGEAQKLSEDRERAERRERREREKLERSRRAEDYQGGGGHELEIRGKQVEEGQGLQIMSRRADDQEPEIFTVL